MKKIKIIIVDDHQLFSQALNGLISNINEFKVLEVFKNGQELVDYLETSKTKPDIVLMDVNMPIMNGIETTFWLKENHPDIKVLALSMENDEQTILKMVRSGAKGYLLKEMHPEILKRGLIEVYKHGFYYTDNVTNSLLNSVNETRNNAKVTLKEREIEFLKLACTQKTYREIAELMFLSPKTIDGYREALFAKLKVKSRIGLVLYAIKEKIVEI